jgi:succinate dehydrogenase / fumarate reductase flavoprotein subunit
VDYNLMSNVPGLFVIGEANFSDHGANRLGASALMQGLADGYFVLPYTIGNYFGATPPPKGLTADHDECRKVKAEVLEQLHRLLSIKGKKSPDKFHRELGLLVWEHCGMGRSEKGLKEALSQIPAIRDEFWKNVCVPGSNEEVNPTLEVAWRVGEFMELAELMCWDALERDESCGAHFREEHQTPDGEAVRNDEDFAHVAVWEYQGMGEKPKRHVEQLEFEEVELATRSYK